MDKYWLTLHFTDNHTVMVSLLHKNYSKHYEELAELVKDR